MTTIPSHDGDLGHNAMVGYDDYRYSGDDGSTFYMEEVLISDKMLHVYITPGEALNLLAWLKQEEEKLKQLVKEQGMIDIFPELPQELMGV